MSHVISSQPASTSPYQPTEIQDPVNGHNPPRMSVTMETRQGQEDCCFRADKSQGCFLYYCCNLLSSICGGIRDCTEKCCNCCADCLNDCCEDKPQKNRKRRNDGGVDFDDYNDDNTWVVGAIHHHDTIVDERPTTNESSGDHYSNSHGTSDHHPSGHHTSDHHSIGHHTSDHHPSGHHTSDHHSIGHHTSDHHSSGHHTSYHHSSGHHTSNHHSSGHHTSSHDSGGHHDSGTCHAGGGDSGGGGGDCGGGSDD